ncbi:hypothetical protein [Urbifossiella limnaea]|uniref:Uncharacterized protein n=1 Tax=Urbifossiella limnaea TaxID=2528023 RepID=A0A517Y1X1_9BACT|nr:hypothetical protein [Urbifossiella limnaea]QDU23752.1 hypothetical protein ETAA1_57590 [Urbifossiella limnaea]
MPHPTTPAGLTPARRRLLALLQHTNFGRVEHLVVRGGEPVLDPMPRVVVEYKFASENGPRPETGNADAALKRQQLDLLALLDRVGDGVIPVLSCKHGLPFQAEVAG